jgi:hypothetical protein
MNEEDKLVQLNARVPQKMRQAARKTAKETGIKFELMIQDLIRLQLGSRDEQVIARCKLYKLAFNRLFGEDSPDGERSPFEDRAVALNA